jgi:hypothetical protein
VPTVSKARRTVRHPWWFILRKNKKERFDGSAAFP